MSDRIGKMLGNIANNANGVYGMSVVLRKCLERHIISQIGCIECLIGKGVFLQTQLMSQIGYIKCLVE